MKGSFFIALIGIIKLIYDLLAPEKKDGMSGPVALLRGCCDVVCCLCMRLFEWFNAGAFTLVNYTGKSYCTSGA